MRKKILIYQDYGCSDVSMLEDGLRCYFEPRGCSIGFTDAAGIIRDDVLNDEVLAFFMPGGAGTPFRRKLEVLGNAKIREYVENGGMYYGICAGAYYACKKTIFEKDIPELSIISECGLDLVDGQAVGTLYKELGIRPYAKNAASSAAVDIIWMHDNMRHTVHYHGGPYFDIDTSSDCEVLAYYDLEKLMPAVIKRSYGKGHVILSGVHFEDKGETLLKAIHHMRIDSAEAEAVALKLQNQELSRLALFNKLMSFVKS